MTASGVVKSWNDGKGWGFIACDAVEGDVFLHVKDCQDGRPNAGDQVSFGLEEDGIRAGQLKAICVTGCTGEMHVEEKGSFKGGFNSGKGGKPSNPGKGAWQQGAPTTHANPELTTHANPEAGPTADGKFAATCKSFNDDKGWGFIDYQGADVFLHVKDCVDGRPQAGDYLTFDVEESGQQAGQLKASNVTGCSGVMEPKGKGKGKGFHQPHQQIQRAQIPQGGITADGKFHACCKSFNDLKGWGFIDFQGADVFLHVKDCLDGRPQAGDMLTFDCEETDRGSAGQLKASNVTGCSGIDEKGSGKGGPMMAQMKGAGNPLMMAAMGGEYGLASKFPALPPTVFPSAMGGSMGAVAPKAAIQHDGSRAQGIVKTYNDGKGWGFIDFQGHDVFLHVKDCVDGRPQAGDQVAFDTEQDGARGGQLKALNVTGCTGEGKGLPGKGGAFGPAPGAAAFAAAGPYGGGFGKMTCY